MVVSKEKKGKQFNKSLESQSFVLVKTMDDEVHLLLL